MTSQNAPPSHNSTKDCVVVVVVVEGPWVVSVFGLHCTTNAASSKPACRYWARDTFLRALQFSARTGQKEAAKSATNVNIDTKHKRRERWMRTAEFFSKRQATATAFAFVRSASRSPSDAQMGFAWKLMARRPESVGIRHQSEQKKQIVETDENVGGHRA